MPRFLIIAALALIIIRPDLGLIATTNPAQEAAADAYCQVHGCGDQAPMDDLDS